MLKGPIVSQEFKGGTSVPRKKSLEKTCTCVISSADSEQVGCVILKIGNGAMWQKETKTIWIN